MHQSASQRQKTHVNQHKTHIDVHIYLDVVEIAYKKIYIETSWNTIESQRIKMRLKDDANVRVAYSKCASYYSYY